MSDSRESSPDTIDIEIDPVSLETNTASRNVRQRRSSTPDNFHIGEPSHIADHTDSEEEPFEDEDTIPPIHYRTPSPLLSASLPSPVAGPSSLPGPSAPIAPSSPVFPSLRFSSRNEGTPISLDWMTISIRAWRQAEQIPVTPLPPELHAPPLTLTRESIPHTIPVIVARLRTHDEQLEELDTALETLPVRVGALEQQADGAERDLQELRDGLVETHDRGVQTSDEVAMLRQETADLRQEVATLRQELAQRDQPRADVTSSD